MRKDQRGFNVYAELKDSYKADVVVKESSAAMRPNVWIFVKDGGIVASGGVNQGSAHLTVEQAKVVRDALDEWIAGVPKRWECVCEALSEYGECPVHPETWQD